jgi:hypothetical protein
LAAKAVNKALGGKVEKWPLEKQVKAMRKLAYVHPKAMPMVRSTLLKDLPEEIQQFSKDGKTREEIKAHYWDCGEFVSFWTLDLKMEEATFDEMVREALEC